MQDKSRNGTGVTVASPRPRVERISGDAPVPEQVLILTSHISATSHMAHPNGRPNTIGGASAAVSGIPAATNHLAQLVRKVSRRLPTPVTCHMAEKRNWQNRG
jgi:hypothetical protein